MDVRLGPRITPTGKCIRWYAERRRFLPLMAFHSVSRRHGSGSVEGIKILGIVLQWRWRCGYHLFRNAVLGSLKVCVDKVVLRVELVPRSIVFLGRRFGSEIGFDRLLPKAQARKNMRRHMQCMRRVRRDLGVAPRSIERLLRKRRIVVGMDDVMSYPGMIWLLGKSLFQNRAGLLLVRICLISG